MLEAALTAAGGDTVNRGVLSKWWIVGAYWMLQSAAVYLLPPAWIASAKNVGAADLGAFTLADYLEVLFSPEWTLWAVFVIPGVILAQLLFLWPVRRPTAARERGWPLWVSLSVAALGLGALGTALIASISQGIYTLTGFHLLNTIDVPIDPYIIFVACGLLSWGAATMLLIRFCKRGPRETMLARLATRLFLGTIIEVVAIIPLDVLIRKRESCYCLAGTYFAMLICGAVGVVFLGPAIFLPLLMKRRRRWYAGKCEWCLYDMSATPKADCCPECGTGWRTASKSSQPTNA